MRKTLQTLLFVAGTATVAQAQTIIPKIGFAVSTTTAEFDSDGEDATVSPKVGLTAGVAVNFPIAEVGSGVISLQPELLYIRKGFQVKGEGEYSDGEVYAEFKMKQKYKINFIELPILARYEFGSEKVRFAPYFGPSFSYGLGGKVDGKITIDEWDETIDMDGDIKYGDPDNGDGEFDVYLDKRLDIGLQFGFSTMLFEKLVLDVRYGVGLTNQVEDEDSANHALQFTVGYPIRLK